MKLWPKRKEMKKRAKHSLRTHYVPMVMLILIMSLLGVGHVDTTDFTNLPSLSSTSSVEYSEETGEISLRTTPGFSMNGVYEALARGDLEGGKEAAEAAQKTQSETNTAIGGLEVAYKRGVLSQIANSLSSGSILVTIFAAIRSVGFLSNDAASVIFTLLSLLVIVALYLFVLSVIEAVVTRAFLEMRIYKKVTIDTFTYFIRSKSWINVALGMAWRALFETLWALTIVGLFIKMFSYCMVPYILAENPTVKPREALKLSMRMMHGHKWECAKLRLSFIGWFLLSNLTSGAVGLFFSYPYFKATEAEYYEYVRGLAIENQIEGYEVFNDTYLFKKATKEEVSEAYTDLFELEQAAQAPEPQRKTKVGTFFANVFGVVWRLDDTEDQYRKHRSVKHQLQSFREDMDGEAYPNRLSPTITKRREVKPIRLQPERHYSLMSIVMIFFLVSIFGWLFEVGMHFITDGEFVNRGVMVGPWLPIYGVGVVLFLMLLNRFRERPALLFLLAVVVAGCLEYFTAFGLETATGGLKWWDYSGYFLNLHGRICAEGLLTFGLGGLAGTYFIAPLIDNLMARVNQVAGTVICIVLIVAFAFDGISSAISPNTGEGVTSVTGMEQES